MLALAIAGGVLWSNVDQYHDVWLAPRGQLHELETIGHEFAGDGPALMTNYEPYGARHFLRGSTPRAPRSCGAASTTSSTGRRSTKARPPTSTASGSTRCSSTARSCCAAGPPRAGRRRPTGSSGAAATTRSGSGRCTADADDRRAPAARRTPSQAAGGAALRRASKALRGSLLVAATRPKAIGLGAPPLRGTQLLRVNVPVDGVYTAWIAGDWFGNASISIDGRTRSARCARS